MEIEDENLMDGISEGTSNSASMQKLFMSENIFNNYPQQSFSESQFMMPKTSFPSNTQNILLQ